MFDYRLFFASSTLDSAAPARRPLVGHGTKRVVRLPSDRPTARQGRR